MLYKFALIDEVVRDKRLVFTLTSYFMSLVILVNLLFTRWFVIGATASLIFFVINAIFLGHAIFVKEDVLSMVLLGSLLLFSLLGLVSWMVLLIYNLDVVRVVTVLLIVTTVSSLMSKMTKRRLEKNLRGKKTTSRASTQMVRDDTATGQSIVKRLYGLRLIYLVTFLLSLCLLLNSRSGEVYTVWGALNPFFMPAFFVATLLLVAIILSSESTALKLLFIILHSILSHLFFVAIFPAGDIGVQQVTLGYTRRVFQNAFTPSNLWPAPNILRQIFYWVSGINLQMAFSVLFARMFSIDVFWSHLLLMPILWGVFVPVIAFMIARALGSSERVSALSSVLISAFPATIFWGTFSVPNSLGFIFAFGTIYFLLRYISENGNYLLPGTLIFSFLSLASHFLTGVLSLSLLMLAVGFKKYENEKGRSLLVARYLLLSSLVFSASLLPMALVYFRLVSPLYAIFSLEKLYGLSMSETVGVFLLGDYFYYYTSPLSMMVHVLGPILGLLGMLYGVRRAKHGQWSTLCRIGVLFLFIGFLLIFIDYRILRFLMVGVPFREERIWLYRDFMLFPFVGFGGFAILKLLRERITPSLPTKKGNPKLTSKPFLTRLRLNLSSLVLYTLILLFISGWITASVYYSYPHFAPLQTTSYEMDAVKHIDEHTTEKYVVICDQWIIFVGQMFEGLYNPNAYYFAHTDPKGVGLFLDMKNNASVDTMVEAMKYNNATVAYFIIQKPRIGAEMYNRIIDQAQNNNLQTYKIFHYPEGQEKLRIFIYRK